MAAPFPWLYSYAADSQSRQGREVLRPVVPVSLAGPEQPTAPRIGLVDTGAESVLAASWLADLAGIDLSTNTDSSVIGIGGLLAEVTFAEVELRLHRADDATESIGWRTDIGFVSDWQPPFAMVLGQVGFLDQFTVTFHRGAAALAIEEWTTFDDRFGAAPASTKDRP